MTYSKYAFLFNFSCLDYSQIPEEVEDDYPDGIVQAEEEEEEHLDSSVFRSRERVQYRDRVGRSSGRSVKKRKLDSK